VCVEVGRLERLQSAPAETAAECRPLLDWRGEERHGGMGAAS
jgi:hypothetical protein